MTEAPRDAGEPSSSWSVRGARIPLDRPVVMGVLNLTPDSFSDGGELPTVEAALARAEAMVAAGADILDLGGESTRPGAEAVEEEEELRRVVPVVRALAERVDVPLSIDTRKSRVARTAVEAGAVIVNDVSGFAHDEAMARTVSDLRAGAVLMHMRGTPADMRERARYRDLPGEVAEELRAGVARAVAAGVAPERIVVDPGIGFAKTAEQSVRMLAHLDRLAALGFPVLVGPGRKSFLGKILGGVPARDRATATAAACVMAWLRGAHIFRVHDVAPVAQALRVAQAVEAAKIEGRGDRGGTEDERSAG